MFHASAAEVGTPYPLLKSAAGMFHASAGKVGTHYPLLKSAAGMLNASAGNVGTSYPARKLANALRSDIHFRYPMLHAPRVATDRLASATSGWEFRGQRSAKP